jgi:hypothetical protein
VQWHFLDEEKSGLDASMFPRVIFNITQSSVRRGLAEDGTRFQIPFQVAKTFGRFHADAEFGPLASTLGRSEWIYGIVSGVELAKTTMLMAELHGRSRMNFSRDVLTVNFGLRHQLTDVRILIASVGHELRDPDQARSFIATAACSCSTERGLLWISSMRFRSRLLRENQNQHDDHRQER